MTEIFKNIIKVVKKIILALMMIVGIVSGAQAQTELTVSYGAYTQMDAMDCHDGGPSVNNACRVLSMPDLTSMWLPDSGSVRAIHSQAHRASITMRISSTIMPLCSICGMIITATRL